MKTTMTIKELKERLKSLGAKTTGVKPVLLERLKTWEENKLGTILVPATAIPAKSQQIFPAESEFMPLNSMRKNFLKDMNESVIEYWFEERLAGASQKNGRVLAMKKFVKYVEVCETPTQLFFKAKCCAETRKHVDYDVRVLIRTSDSGLEMYQGNCSCPAGAGWSAACKHVSALSYVLEHFGVTGETLEFVSQTSALQSWHKPSGRNVQPMSIFEITNSDPKTVDSDPTIMDTLVNKLISDNISSPLLLNRNVQGTSFLHDHDAYCREFYWSIMESINRISKQEAESYEKKTRTQSCSKLWKELRKSRITGSVLGSVLSTVRSNKFVTGPAKKNAMPGRNMKFVKALSWGTEHESIARKEYCVVMGIDIHDCGLFIHPENTFLASTPDGINQELSLVIEIKCPFSIRNEHPTKAKYLEKSGEVYSLKRNHSYYAQIQLHMYVTGCTHCDFIVWTKAGIFVESIPFNLKYCVKSIDAATLYFKRVFAPYYVENVLYK